MFFEVLDKVRKKPAHTKQTIALTISASVTLVIAFFWVVSFGGYISEKSQAGMFSAVAVPFKEITETLGAGLSGVKKNANAMFKKDMENAAGIVSTSTKDYSMYNISPEEEYGALATSTSAEELIQ